MGNGSSLQGMTLWMRTTVYPSLILTDNESIPDLRVREIVKKEDAYESSSDEDEEDDEDDEDSRRHRRLGQALRRIYAQARRRRRRRRMRRVSVMEPVFGPPDREHHWDGLSLIKIPDVKGCESDGSEAICITCVENLRAIRLLPCRHVSLCLACAKTIAASPYSKCPMCRSIVTRVERLVVVDNPSCVDQISCT